MLSPTRAPAVRLGPLAEDAVTAKIRVKHREMEKMRTLGNALLKGTKINESHWVVLLQHVKVVVVSSEDVNREITWRCAFLGLSGFQGFPSLCPPTSAGCQAWFRPLAQNRPGRCGWDHNIVFSNERDGWLLEDTIGRAWNATNDVFNWAQLMVLWQEEDERKRDK